MTTITLETYGLCLAKDSFFEPRETAKRPARSGRQAEHLRVIIRKFSACRDLRPVVLSSSTQGSAKGI